MPPRYFRAQALVDKELVVAAANWRGDLEPLLYGPRVSGMSTNKARTEVLVRFAHGETRPMPPGWAELTEGEYIATFTVNEGRPPGPKEM
jgi:hypothetical protein